LVEAFAGAAVHVHDLNARLLLGEKINILEHSTAISTMVRIATRIGCDRLPREIGVNPLDYVKARDAEDDDE
jgi:hypothetical protein